MRHLTVLILVLSLTACSGGGSGSAGSVGSLNPFNWFGGGKGARTAETGQSLIPQRRNAPGADTRGLIEQITTLTVGRATGGKIVRATGLPPSQGYYDAELVTVESQKPGELVFEFRINAPLRAPRTGTPFSRDITAATFLTPHDLAGIRVIRVIAARNNRTTRP